MRRPIIWPAVVAGTGLTGAYALARLHLGTPINTNIQFAIAAVVCAAVAGAIVYLRLVPHLVYMGTVTAVLLAVLVRLGIQSARAHHLVAHPVALVACVVFVGLAWPSKKLRPGEHGFLRMRIKPPLPAQTPQPAPRPQVQVPHVPPVVAQHAQQAAQYVARAGGQAAAALRRRDDDRIAALQARIDQLEHEASRRSAKRRAAAQEARLSEVEARIATAEQRTRQAEDRALEAERRELEWLQELRRARSEIVELLPVGHAFGGRWQLVPDAPPVGSGTFGTVLLVQNLRPRPGEPQLAAMKVLRSDVPAPGHATHVDDPSDDQYRRRLLREVEVLRGLDSVHIAKLHDGGFDPNLGKPFLVMTYYRSGSLAAALAARSLQLDVMLRYAADVFRGLVYLHGRPTAVVHRDVKPGNVLLSDDRRGAVLCDFSIARLHDLQMTQLTVGLPPHTPFYAAPEQLRGSTEPPIDVHAAAACVYAMLTGQPPYRRELAQGSISFADAVLRTDVRPAPLRALRPDLAPELCHAVDSCLDRDPARRPPAASLVPVFDRQGEADRPTPNIAFDVTRRASEPATLVDPGRA